MTESILNNKKLLIVDDEPDILAVIEQEKRLEELEKENVRLSRSSSPISPQIMPF